MQWIRRAAALVLSAALLFGLAVSAGAFQSVSQEVQLAIEIEDRLNEGLVDVELSYGHGLSALDWSTLKDNGVTFQMRYFNTYYRFRPADVSRTMGYEELNLSRTEVPDELMDEICAKTGLEEDEFMVVLPSMLGKLPGTATVGICLDQDFMNNNGHTGLNVYGIDFVRNVSYREADEDEADSADDAGRVRETSYGISAIGLAASGKAAEKTWSPWISISTNVSRMLLITTRSIGTYGSMSWNQSSGAIQSANEVFSGTASAVTPSNPGSSSGAPVTDANPNTGVSETQLLLVCGIAALGAATVYTLARTLHTRKRRD